MSSQNSNPLPISGIRLGAVNVGIKQTQRADMCLIEIPEGAVCASVFTQNRFAAAPVIVAKQHLDSLQSPRYLLINSGNANCGTGTVGIADAQALCEQLAKSTNCKAQQILPFSTGVIGERLPRDRMLEKLPRLVAQLDEKHWASAASAIMTTDTREKMVSLEYEVGSKRYAMTGIAKGSGMIKPNMATMLSFIATDAPIAKPLLERALLEAVEISFNRITIDGDTSTNDACVLIATGDDENNLIDENHPAQDIVIGAVSDVCTALAKAIVADGEGATKFVEIIVASDHLETSKTIAFTVAESPLVKTALFAGDPNWGRILAAIGRAPVEPFDINEVEIYLGDYQIVEGGCVIEGYDESMAAAVMSRAEIPIAVKIGRGNKLSTVWTCDLSYDYVKINAEYRS